MKNQIDLDKNEWVTLKVASENSIYSTRQIQKLAEKGVERIGTKKLSDGTVLYNMKHILQYATSHHATPILDPVWDEMTYIHGEKFYPIPGYDCKYFITDKNRVIDVARGRVLTVSPPRKDGYRQVGLWKDGEAVDEYLHRLIGFTQCSNVLGKDIFHHIEPSNPAIDKPSNILPVWKWQHDELHGLLRQGKMKEYQEMVAQIKKENKQKLYRIPHLDFSNDENFKYYMWVTSDGYKAYKAGGDVPLNSIMGQHAEYIGERKAVEAAK